MHSPLPWLANTIWKHSCRTAWVKFHKACKSPNETQRRILLSILARNKDTQFGKENSFNAISTVKEYQQAVPIRDYKDFQPYIQHIMQGGNNILTSDPINRLEPTSGTSGPMKYIPATSELRADFQAAIQPWIYNLFKTHPKCMAGPAYWFLSPRTSIEQPPGCVVKVGYADDVDYLNAIERKLLRPIMALPKGLATISNTETHQYLSLLFLLYEKNLRLLSLWNATSFLVLLEKAGQWKDRLTRDIANGSLPTQVAIPPKLRQSLEDRLKANPRRAERINHYIEDKNWQNIWPNLQVISCWASSWAEKDAIMLHSIFPKAALQPKGLLATEGVITIPIHDGPMAQAKHVAAVNSHFLEFEEEENKQIFTLDSIEPGRIYNVILTSSGGLYRYRLNDRVKCTGYWHNTPVLDFIGKTKGFSDIYGEKLNEDHVKTVLEKAFANQKIDSNFSFIAAHPGKNPLRYSLFYATASDHNFTTLTEDIERGLCENYHYRHCRSLGQLETFTIHQIPVSAIQKYITFKSKHSKASTAKLLLLESPQDWLDILM